MSEPCEMTDERAREILEWMYSAGIKPEGVMAQKASRTRESTEPIPAVVDQTKEGH